MKKSRIIETAIDDNGCSYIFSDQKKDGWQIPGHTITDLFFSEKSPPCMMQTNCKFEDINFNLSPGEIRFFRSDIHRAHRGLVPYILYMNGYLIPLIYQ